jgi:lipoate---protein ligase
MGENTFRLLATPPASAAWNMALDAVLLEGCGPHPGERRPASPPTFRLMRFDPPAVLVGAYQSVEAEVRLEECRRHGFHISRRVTGGGAIFFDRSQVGWELLCPFETLGWPNRPGEALFRHLSRPIISALGELGIDARYRPRNDIEVRGRKISGTGGTELRGGLLFQATLLVDFDIESMLRALRVPVEKLRRQELEGMRDRVTWISREIGRVPSVEELDALLAREVERRLGVELRPGELTDWERARLEELLPSFDSEEYVYGRGRPGGNVGKSIYPTEGGVIRVTVRTGADPNRVLSLVIDGDFFAFPQRSIYDLEAALKGARGDKIGDLIEAHLEKNRVEIPGVGARALTAAVLEALERARGESFGLAARRLNKVYPVRLSLAEATSLRPTHLLLPYCAKPVDCALRRLDACDGCGECSIGEAYEIAQNMGLIPCSITSFEHLIVTVEELARRGSTGYVGSCCEAFYLKHRRELEAIEVPGLLFDVLGSETCYDLGKSAYAYRGDYEGKTDVDLELLGELLRKIWSAPR